MEPGDLLQPLLPQAVTCCLLHTYADGELATYTRAGPVCCWVGHGEGLPHFRGCWPHPHPRPGPRPAPGGFLRPPHHLGEVRVLPTLTWGAWPLSQSPVSWACVRGRARSREVPDQAFALPAVLTAPHPLLQQRVHPQPCLRQRQREQGGRGGAAHGGAGGGGGCCGREREIRVFLGTFLSQPKGMPQS